MALHVCNNHTQTPSRLSDFSKAARQSGETWIQGYMYTGTATLGLADSSLGGLDGMMFLLYCSFRKRRNSQSKVPAGGKKKHVPAEEEESGSEEAEEETPEPSLQLASASGTTQQSVITLFLHKSTSLIPS